MITEFANHLWQSTLFALGAGILTLVLRRNSAAHKAPATNQAVSMVLRASCPMTAPVLESMKWGSTPSVCGICHNAVVKADSTRQTASAWLSNR